MLVTYPSIDKDKSLETVANYDLSVITLRGRLSHVTVLDGEPACESSAPLVLRSEKFAGQPSVPALKN